MKTDLVTILPQSVTARFPRADDGNPFAGAFYAVTVTLASLALPEFAGVPTHAGSHVLKDFREAVYTGGVLQNGADLAALANQLATDWYRFRAAPLDQSFAGAVPWTPEALSDRVTFDFSAGAVRTRVCRPPYRTPDVQLLPSGTAGGGGPDVDYYQIVQDAGASQTQRTKLNFIPGARVTLSFADDAVNDATNLTLATDADISDSTVTYTTDVFYFISSTVTFTTVTFNVTNTTITLDGGSIFFGGCVLADYTLFTPSNVQQVVNDYDPGVCKPVLYIDTTNVIPSCTLTGLVGAAFEEITVINLGPNPVLLPHEDARSAAANRWRCPNAGGNGEYRLNQGEGVRWHHDDNTRLPGGERNRWHCEDDEKAAGTAATPTCTGGQVTLSPNFALGGSYVGVAGMSVTLPTAGTYLLSYSATARLQNDSPPAAGQEQVLVKLYDATAGADVPGTEQQACELTTTNALTPVGLQNATGNAAAAVRYAVTGATVVKLYAKLANGAAGVTGVLYGAPGSGVAVLAYVKVCDAAGVLLAPPFFLPAMGM